MGMGWGERKFVGFGKRREEEENTENVVVLLMP
jgi:hypothetical protein